ncbi:MAG TPA: Hpt domain-containing protein, partial [Polyangiaceae bacterium]
MSDSEDAELLQIFLEEAREHLDGIEGDFIQLESKEELDLEVVNKIFRAVHSVKGGAGFFGLDSIKMLSHAMENVLGIIRKDQAKPTPGAIGLLLKSADALVQMVDNPAATSDVGIAGFVTDLEALCRGDAALAATPQAKGASQIRPPDTPAQDLPASAPAPGSNTTFGESPVEPKPTDVPLVGSASASDSRSSDNLRATAPRTARQSLPMGESSIRVHVGILDRLMTLAGELVLTRNQLIQSHDGDSNSNSEATQRIDHITTELQDAIMSTRMQSIGTVFQKFRRVVRDLANSLEKEVDLIIEGEEVELDRSIVE